jgi:hypothetical protein
VSNLTFTSSDDEYFGHAPSTDNESTTSQAYEELLVSKDEAEEQVRNDFINGIMFRKSDKNATAAGDNYCGEMSDLDSECLEDQPEQDSDKWTGLHWDTSYNVNDSPTIFPRVKAQYKYLFKAPIDSFFALVPYIFCEIFCEEINQYAKYYLNRKQGRQICGYIWKAVTINELFTYFGVLVFSMLYPLCCIHKLEKEYVPLSRLTLGLPIWVLACLLRSIPCCTLIITMMKRVLPRTPCTKFAHYYELSRKHKYDLLH